MGVHFKLKAQKTRKLVNFPRAEHKSLEIEIHLLNQNTAAWHPGKHILTLTAICEVIRFKYFEKFDGQRKVQLPIHTSQTLKILHDTSQLLSFRRKQSGSWHSIRGCFLQPTSKWVDRLLPAVFFASSSSFSSSLYL